tara:strand:+ start:1446 stop:1892 length:447 start_codon:yes stop_codon:yes gene_type:complete
VVDDAASLDAVGVSASLVRQENGVLTLLHVIEVERSLPVTADMDLEAQRGEDLLGRARVLAESEIDGAAIQDQLLQARVAGPAIVEEAEERNVDVIVLGVGWTPLLGKFEIGPTAGYVLKHASCNVWIVRDQLELTPENVVEKGSVGR